MKIKNKIIISLVASIMTVALGSSFASATESSWQNLNPSIETGLSGTAHNCSPLTVTNGTVAVYPTCTITCNSGYSLSGSTCVIISSGGGGGGGGYYIAPQVVATTTPAPVATTTTPVVTTPTPAQGCSGGNRYNTSTGALCINNSLPQGSQGQPGTQGQSQGQQGQGVSSFSRDFDLGSKGDDVLALQKFLNSKGFIIASSGSGSIGNETTTFGGATQKALAKFQKANGLLAQGYFGAKTRALIASMGETTPANNAAQTTPTTPDVKLVSFTRDLRLGSRGNDVLALQKFLVAVNAGPKAGELVKNGLTTYFGNLTRSVLAEYQASVGIKPASGYFGPTTRAYVESHR